jgi:hypothetical protein
MHCIPGGCPIERCQYDIYQHCSKIHILQIFSKIEVQAFEALSFMLGNVGPTLAAVVYHVVKKRLPMEWWKSAESDNPTTYCRTISC